MEFPTLVYRNGGKYSRPGGTYGTATASDEEQLDGLLDSGWYLSLPEAIDGKKKSVVKAVVVKEAVVKAVVVEDEPKDDDGPTREEMEEKAKELGIKVHHKLGDKNLFKLIQDKLAE